jgi:hypothetical protein
MAHISGNIYNIIKLNINKFIYIINSLRLVLCKLLLNKLYEFIRYLGK